jgi:hypothetical protein
VILRIPALALFLALLAAPAAARACSCADVTRAAPARLGDFVAQAERVVHARVVQVISRQEARIEVIESFKGGGERLEALPGNDANCGFSFAPGEERVYFVFNGVVNLCGRAAPRAELLERLRKFKVAEPAACEGIVRPARPAPQVAIKEEEQSVYEPLDGADAELPLGAGHVRPAREADRHDWTRRLLLPVFAAPGGELKLWLTPGSVGTDALIETGYETVSFIALQARESGRDAGWLQIRFGGPLSSGAGWVHRCHLEAATPRLEYEPWEKLFASQNVSPLYFRAWAPHALRKTASPASPLVARIPGDPNRYGMQPLEFQGDWARVRVSIPSDACADPKPTRPTVYEGWIRWRSRERGPSIWYYTRGC